MFFKIKSLVFLSITTLVMAPAMANTVASKADTIQIENAIYESINTPSRYCDATAAVAKECNGKTSCAFLVDNSLCGDPDPNNSLKHLLTNYHCGTKLVTMDTPEYQNAKYPCS